jgi:hypothetical protein
MGEAVFPHLSKPDTKFATVEKPHGHFRVGLALDAKDAATRKFIADMEARKVAAIAEQEKELGKKIKKIADSPWKAEEDEDGNPTGRIIFNFKKPGGGKRKDGTEYTTTVDLFDSRGTKLNPSTVRIGGGSKLVVSFEPRGFYVPASGAGISLRLAGVQVRELVEWGESRDAAGYGFESDEEGFVAEPAPSAGQAEAIGEDSETSDI